TAHHRDVVALLDVEADALRFTGAGRERAAQGVPGRVSVAVRLAPVALSQSMIASTSLVERLSRFRVGSSASSIAGAVTSERATATRGCAHTESSLGLCPAGSSS
ncbi:hypothetical protein UK12_34860, partial [Saccharothrix sp. ST-888]